VSRGTTNCAQGAVITGVWLALDWLAAREGGVPYGWAQLGPRLLVGLLGPLGLLLFPRLRHARALPLVVSLFGFGFTLGTDWVFFALGQHGTLFHGISFYMCLLSVCSVLPLGHGQRRGFIALAVAAHVALELLWPDGRTVGARLLACAQMGTGMFTLLVVLELFFRGQERNAALKQEMGRALDVLTENRARIGEAAQTLAGSVASLSGSAQALSGHAGRTEAESAAMAGAADRIAGSARALLGRSRSSVTAVAEAGAYAQGVSATVADVERGVEELSAAVGACEEHFGHLQQHSRRIGSFVELVQRISAQTQMLALNTGIEAARAGHAGKGFGVIATEVRKLATQVAQSGREVEGVVRDLHARMGSAAGAMGEVHTRTLAQQQLFAQAREQLEGIQAVVQALREAADANAGDADAQAQGTDAISTATARLLPLLQDQARMSAEVAATGGRLEALARSLRTLLPAEGAPAAPPPGPPR
jgi:methyl-accepting chemotaxis protein